MKEINELNRRLLAEVGDRFGEDGFMLERREVDPELEEVPAPLRAEIESLRERINQAVPNDVTWRMWLGSKKASLTFEYEDGAMTSGSFGGPRLQHDRSALEQLQEHDWDAMRAQNIGMAQAMQEWTASTKNMPSQLPGTKALQKRFREEMKAWVKSKRKETSGVHVMLCGRNPGPDGERFENMEAFRYELPNIMTVQQLVITVMEHGKPLPVARIEALKRQALNSLKEMPMSFAKAHFKM